MAENRLAQSSSAYLRSASHQPIDWYEFGEEAFARARELDRLILLDIGAVWCHWCHVIDRESYENDEIAQLINAHYIAVKVDRDQRPDIDARYQQIIASLTGQGGWPLTAFLTPDGRVLYGGTYFPPQAMKKLLDQLKDVYREQKNEIMRESLDARSQEDIQASLNAAETEAVQHRIPPDVFERIIEQAKGTFDNELGGFGLQPKFPHFSTLEFLIQQAVRESRGDLDKMLHTTLIAMAQGGMHDHIGGGFHRYSVDRQWHVPHFEKMAYDNAEALKVYAQAYKLSQNPLYRDTVDGILRFVGQVLSDQEQGGFYASQDADIDLNDDGDYFTWTQDELKAILSPEEADTVLAYYDITPEGDMHERPGRNVLWAIKPLEAVAEVLNRSKEDVQSLLQTARVKMAEQRRKRQTPFVDNTVYLNWNGMMLTGYFEAADLLDIPEARAFAQKTLERLLKTHVDSEQNRLLHVQGIPGMLEDYAWMIHALLKGYQSTEEQGYLEAAKQWTEVTITQFEDKTFGGFFDIATPGPVALALLKYRRKPTDDTPSSSANAVMIRNLIQLHLLTVEQRYVEVAEKALRMFGQEFANRGIYVAAMATALYEFQHPPVKLEALGQDADALKSFCRKTLLPGKVMLYTPAAEKSQVRVCEGTRCLSPATSTEELMAQLATLAPQKVHL